MEPSPHYNGIKAALREIEEDIFEAKMRRSETEDNDVILIAVSKKKPTDLIIEAYEEGQRHFGENYVNELIEKANSLEILEKCPDIKWHFIGHLQSNKAKKLLEGCPNLYMVHTIDSIKLADLINSCWEKKNITEKLRVMVQVNTSQEESKSGTNVGAAETIFEHILTNCPHLNLIGLMTIGMANYDFNNAPNPDYVTLIKLRNQLCEQCNLSRLDLSFGMSKDYQHAIALGSSYIRVGEKIFGSRVPAKAACESELEVDTKN